MHDLSDLAEDIMEQNALRVPSLGEPTIGKPYSTMVGGVATSAVEAYVPLLGDATLVVRAFEHRSDVSFNESEQALVARYVADPLSTEAAMRLFDEVIGRLRYELEQCSEEANEFNKGLAADRAGDSTGGQDASRGPTRLPEETERPDRALAPRATSESGSAPRGHHLGYREEHRCQREAAETTEARSAKHS